MRDINFDCSKYTAAQAVGFTGTTQEIFYTAAAHVLEFTPESITFSQPVSGPWRATLTVEVYQM